MMCCCFFLFSCIMCLKWHIHVGPVGRVLNLCLSLLILHFEMYIHVTINKLLTYLLKEDWMYSYATDLVIRSYVSCVDITQISQCNFIGGRINVNTGIHVWTWQEFCIFPSCVNLPKRPWFKIMTHLQIISNILCDLKTFNVPP